ncbi:hypothetical protein ACWD6I_09765 [Streptomyces sp. NPDC002454]
MDPVAGWTFGTGLVMLAGAVHLVRNRVVGGGVGRNSAVGIRTRATTASDPAWAAGHAAAVPMLTATCRTGYAAGGATWAIGPAGAWGGAGGPAVLVVPLVGIVAVLALLAAAAVTADAAARAVTAVTAESRADAKGAKGGEDREGGEDPEGRSGRRSG